MSFLYQQHFPRDIRSVPRTRLNQVEMLQRGQTQLEEDLRFCAFWNCGLILHSLTPLL